MRLIEVQCEEKSESEIFCVRVGFEIYIDLIRIRPVYSAT